MSQALTDLSRDLADLVQTASKDVAGVDARASGFLWQPGVIVTAAGAAEHRRRIRITLPDGSTAAAELAGRDPGLDLAVLRCDTAPAPSLVHHEGELRPGQMILTLGRSHDTGPRASMGILSSVAAGWRNRHGRKIDPFLRLDAALHPGSAGGPVVDAASGRLIGMAVNTFSRFSVVAVPAAVIAKAVRQILESGGVARGYLGVGLQPVRVLGISGIEPRTALILINVEPESPAAAAGFLLGDVVLSIEGHEIEQPDDVIAFLEPERIGQKLEVEIVRGGERRTLSVTVGAQPRQEGC
ncbi:MAG: trypsin-like peptidase domain-containing protein [Bryobacteraceae bacterium]